MSSAAMSKNQKMEFKINCSPHLKMSEITKRLFNRNFHSDVQFSVEGKIIYAHSLELIKRSVVFEQQLEGTMGDQKLIPINDCKYENFLEFMRYIYTDECIINDDNFVDILRMAAKYQFIKLENQIMNFGKSVKWLLKQFEHCVRDKYEIPKKYIEKISANDFGLCVKNKQFLSLHPDAVDEFLKFEVITKGITEVQIFTAVAEWITSYCRVHQITISEGRVHWDKLIRRIRFPTMSTGELRECYTKYPQLLSDSDRMSIGSQTVFGGDEKETELWISKSREEYFRLTDYRIFQRDAEYKTIFAVSKETILHGLRIAIEAERKPIEIEISESDDKTEDIQKINFVQSAPHHYGQLMINLGESIRLQPNFKYTINIKYLETDGNVSVLCRKKTTDVIITDPGKTVKLIEASDNMMEMFFKIATD